jgi:hypothetical protein
MKLTAEQIQENWELFLENINEHVSFPRKEHLIQFYKKYEDRIILMPAAHKKEYHNAFPGGYVDHVNRVVAAGLKLKVLWEEFGADTSLFTTEELVFSAINHDLGKIGDENYEAYIPQTDQWRKDKLGEEYTHNNQLAFASVPDRGLYMLQSHGIQYTFNEMIAIQTHDGLYDDGNKKYLMGFTPELKPRTSLPYILHQADLLAARVEFEKEWLPKLGKTVKNSVPGSKKVSILTPRTNTKTKALNSISSPSLKNMLDSL